MFWPTRRKFLDMDTNAPVKVWTTQHPDAWIEAQRRGWLSGKHPWSYMRAEDEDQASPQFVRAYEWMRKMMAERIPEFSGDLPVWCWHKRSNPRQKSMRLSEPYVRIAALVPRSRILASGHSEWHSVLNGMPLVGEEEWYAWDKATIWGACATGKVAAGVEKTWEGVFDLRPRTGVDAQWMGQPNIVQFCVDRIKLDEIISVRTFSI